MKDQIKYKEYKNVVEFGNVQEKNFVAQRDDYEDQSHEKIKELTEEMNLKKQNEKYDECKFIKDKIDKIKKITLKKYVLEEEKKESANRDDFDQAQEIKTNIEKVEKLLEYYSSKEYKYEETNI